MRINSRFGLKPIYIVLDEDRSASRPKVLAVKKASQTRTNLVAFGPVCSVSIMRTNATDLVKRANRHKSADFTDLCYPAHHS